MAESLWLCLFFLARMTRMQNPHREDKAAICSPALFAKESNEHNTPLQPRGLGSQHWLSDHTVLIKLKQFDI
jgi:hypothetical protein